MEIMKNLSENEKKVLDAYNEYQALNNGQAPSERVLAKMVCVSKTAIHKLKIKLLESGLLGGDQGVTTKGDHKKESNKERIYYNNILYNNKHNVSNNIKNNIHNVNVSKVVNNKSSLTVKVVEDMKTNSERNENVNAGNVGNVNYFDVINSCIEDIKSKTSSNAVKIKAVETLKELKDNENVSESQRRLCNTWFENHKVLLGTETDQLIEECKQYYRSILKGFTSTPKDYSPIGEFGIKWLECVDKVLQLNKDKKINDMCLGAHCSKQSNVYTFVKNVIDNNGVIDTKKFNEKERNEEMENFNVLKQTRDEINGILQEFKALVSIHINEFAENGRYFNVEKAKNKFVDRCKKIPAIQALGDRPAQLWGLVENAKHSLENVLNIANSDIKKAIKESEEEAKHDYVEEFSSEVVFGKERKSDEETVRRIFEGTKVKK